MVSHEISVQGKPSNIEVDGYGHLLDQRRNFLLGTSTCTIYNRAFVKNYTKLLFKKTSPHLNRGIRVAIDDKAYLRCGTSEGFSRPIHKPVHLSDPEMKFQLPASDYPKSCGYISPGVIMMVNEMDEVERNGDDKYSPADVTISVNCKPKSIYSSDSTNWANNLYANRLRFRDEHELPLHASREEADLVNVPENFVETVIFLRDSLQQFEVMTIQEDFIRVKSGGDHLEREKGLMFKNNSFLPVVTKIKMNFDALQNLENKCENLLAVISSDLTISEVILISYYNELRDMSRAIRLEMETEVQSN